MDMKETNISCVEEMKRIIIKERGERFWQLCNKVIEQNQRENFMEGYRYAIRSLQDGLIKDK